MKHTALALAAALLLAAQPVYAQALSFGVRGGLNYATADVKGEDFPDAVGYRTGFHAGILGSVEIAKNFALQTEFMYSQKGFSKGDGDVALKLNYLEIPVMAVIKFPAKISPHIYLGVVLGLETGCKVSSGDIENVDCDAAIQQNLDTPRTKGADSGLMFGGGVIFDLGSGGILLDAIFNYGLTDISEPGGGVDDMKTRTFYLSAGYVLPIGG
jgi:hypothetical protein